MDVAALRASRLAPYAYTVLPQHHPLKAELRPDYLAALARHQAIKAELVPLISAWREAGIEVLLYKGFYFAEFVYPAPGARFHGDVDLLVRPDQAPLALKLALRRGWSMSFDAEALERPSSHAAFVVYRQDGATRIDGHRWIIRRSLQRHDGPLRLTQAMWAHSILRDWEHTVVRVPTPTDALLMGLVLDRCVGEGWRRFKPHDALDVALLMEQGLTLEQVRQRARELGIPRTTELALSCYDSAASTLTPPVRWSVPWHLLVGLTETGAIRWPVRVDRLARGPGLARDIVMVLPIVLRVRRALHHYRDIREILNELTPDPLPSTQSSRQGRWRTVRALWWAFRLLQLGPQEGDCLPRSLAIYHALRRQGWPVVFVSGVRREGGRIVGHAWVELDGGLLSELYHRPDQAVTYVPSFRHP